MNRIIVVMAIAVAACGCGQVQREFAKLSGYGEQCVNGVLCYQFASGAALAVDANGQPLLCTED